MKGPLFATKCFFSFCIFFQILPTQGFFVSFLLFCFCFCFVFILFCFCLFVCLFVCFFVLFVWFFFRTSPFQKILANGLTVIFRQNKASLHHFGRKISKLPVHAPQGGEQSSLQCVHIHVGPQKCKKKNVY